MNINHLSPNDLVKQYNASVMKWIKFMTKKYPKNEELKKIQLRVAMLKRDMPEQVIELSGTFLYKYKDPIQKNDEKFFRNIRNIPELASQQPDSYAVKIFTMLSDIYLNNDEAIKQEVYTDIINMLSFFICYVAKTNKLYLIDD